MDDACLVDFMLPQCWGGAIGETVAGGAVSSLADAVSQGLAQAISSIATLWVDFPTPAIISGSEAPQPVTPPDVAGVTTVMQYVMWICLAVAVISLMGLGALIATRRRTGEGIAAVGRLGFILGGVLIISAAGAIVTGMLPSGPTEFGAASYLQSRLWWFMGGAAVVGVAIGGARMAWEQRGEPGRDTLKSLLTLAVVAGSSTVIISMLTVAADSFSSWLIADSLDCSIEDTDCFAEGIEVMFALGNFVGAASGPGAALGAIIVIVFGLMALLASGVQIMLMIARSAMLVILTGILPLAASATNTEMGKSWFKRSVGWAVAFILYKPAAAIVYATGFQLIGEGDLVSTDSLVSSLAGLLLLGMALVALPALLRFTVPMVGAMAGGAAGGGAVAAGMAALPTGAMALSGGGGGGKNGAAAAAGASGPSGPSGSDGTSGKGTQGGAGPAGGQAPGGSGGGSGGGAAGSGAGTTAGGAGATAGGAGAGAGTAGGGAAAASGGAAGGAAAAGSAAGPAGMAAGKAAEGAMKAGQAAKSGAESAAGESEGPSGSND